MGKCAYCNGDAMPGRLTCFPCFAERGEITDTDRDRLERERVGALFDCITGDSPENTIARLERIIEDQETLIDIIVSEFKAIREQFYPDPAPFEVAPETWRGFLSGLFRFFGGF